MQTPRRLIVPVLSLTVLSLLAGTAPTVAATPAGTDSSQSAWIVVRHPQDPSGTPAVMDRGNSTGGGVTWSRSGPGEYTVFIAGLPDTGVPQVTALSPRPRICVVPGWGGGEPVEVSVRCTGPGGTSRDTAFALTWTRGTSGSGGSSGRLAHAWISGDDPDDYYEYVTDGGTITRSSFGPGNYEATISGLGNALATGTVQLTQYGSPGACKTVRWTSGSGNIYVEIMCRELDGSPADAQVDLLFLRKLGPEGFGGGPAAYLWAERKSQSAAYQPQTAYAWQSNGKRSTIDRTAIGTYKVTLKQLPKGGAAIVTAHGTSKARCQPRSISTTAPATVVVRCYRPNGTLVDSNFTLAWTK